MQDFPHLTPSELVNLISQSFEFEWTDPPLPQFCKLGRLRVVGVVINESTEPEICLLDESDPEQEVLIYPISHLKVNLPLSIAA